MKLLGSSFLKEGGDVTVILKQCSNIIIIVCYCMHMRTVMMTSAKAH